MKTKMIFAAAALVIVSSVAAFAQKATIDLRFNALAEDANNYFNWTADGKNVKDAFDAASGASKAKSTTEFNVVRFDASGSKKAIPAGLRSFVLYPVAPRATAEGDAFMVSESGKMLTIRFIHRGVAYQIMTDAKGNIDMASSFQIATVGDNVGGKFMLKNEYVKAGGDKSKMADVDWSKVPFAKDVADSDAGYTYSGSLKAAYKNGILTVKGNLQKK
ncbi:MAG: hypothetical protein IJR50_03400 [Treponema sp.]|nr:hypothetical protein [Treponema sp.]